MQVLQGILQQAGAVQEQLITPGIASLFPLKLLKRCHSRIVHDTSTSRHALRRTYAIVPLGNQLRQWMVKATESNAVP